jgi:two-component system, NarL family, nitrate/nitrite sensor histidine kinase NarX
VEKNIIAVRWVTFSALIITAASLLLPVVDWSSKNRIGLGLLVILAAAMLTWAVETWLRFVVTQLRVDVRGANNQGELLHQDATLILAASRAMWSARTQREIIEIVMKTGSRVLDSTGASFTRLDEWELPSEALTMGSVPSGKDDDWPSRLGHASTRQACRRCSLREAGAECILGKDVVDQVSKVFCLPIERGEREYGLVNFFFTAPAAISELKKQDLRLLSEYAGFALENLFQMRRGTVALHHLESSRAKKDFTSSLRNISEAIRRELNFNSVAFWGPRGNEEDVAARLLTSALNDTDGISVVGDETLAMELWRELLKTNQSFIREVDLDQGRRIGLWVIPIEATPKVPIGMMLCAYESADRDFSHQVPMLNLAARSIGAILRTAMLAEQLEYQAARDERYQLAREIHDGLAQTLAYLKIQTSQMLNYLNRGNLDTLEASLTSSYQTLSAAYQDARREIENLRFVAEIDTQDWLVNLARGFRDDTGMDVDVSGLKINARLPLAIQSQLIRIVQEALNNVRQHAQAEKVSIAGSVLAGEVVLEISDDGRGFEPETVDTGSRYGLVGMRERTDMLGGEFQIISMQDKGTTVRVTLPLETHKGIGPQEREGE